MAKNIPIFLHEHSQCRDLNCPDCNLSMQTFKCNNILVDKCRQCHGVWFTENEIGAFKKALDSFNLSSLVKLESTAIIDDSYKISICPCCEETLVEQKYAYNTKVILRNCSLCRGTWLSFLDLIKMIEIAHISQVIAEDVKGLLQELKGLDQNMTKIRKLKWIVRVLKTKVGQ